jgi:hypothetical protein
MWFRAIAATWHEALPSSRPFEEAGTSQAGMAVKTVNVPHATATETPTILSESFDGVVPVPRMNSG